MPIELSRWRQHLALEPERQLGYLAGGMVFTGERDQGGIRNERATPNATNGQLFSRNHFFERAHTDVAEKVSRFRFETSRGCRSIFMPAFLTVNLNAPKRTEVA